MPDKEINKLLNKADDLFEKSYSTTELNILRGYKKALDEIRLKISNEFEKYGNTPSITDLRRLNRLDALEQQITKIIATAQRPMINKIASEIKNTFTESYTNTGFAIKTGTGVDFGFTIIPKESIKYAMEDSLWLDALKDSNSKLLTDTKRELENYLRLNAREDIASGLAQGKPYSVVTTAIKNRFDIAATRAKIITFTEMHKSHSKGRLEGIKKAQESGDRLGIKVKKIWKHNAVGQPRPDHVKMDNKPANEKGIFILPDNTKTEPPGLTGVAKHDISCHCSTVVSVEGLE
jgi:hypothetical protein